MKNNKSDSDGEKRGRPAFKAEMIRKELKRISQKYKRNVPIVAGLGPVDAEDVVSESKDKRAALHDQFEWEDSKVAHQHRLWQARQLITYVAIILPSGGKTNRYVSLQIEKPEGEGFKRVQIYVETERALKSDQFRGQVLAKAKQDFKNMADRYRHLVELANIVDAIDELK